MPPKKTISLVIPFIDGWEFLNNCLTKIAANTVGDLELVLIDNGSDQSFEKDAAALLSDNITLKYLRNKVNEGVLSSFKQGFKETDGDIICFIHSDVLIHEQGWNDRLLNVFDENPALGLAGLFGAHGVGQDGGRFESMSNMLGLEWGKCDCHTQVALHHGNLMAGVDKASVLDGVGMFFSREFADKLVADTDMFDDWRAPHHFYDRIMPLKAIDLGFEVAVVGIGFDHFSGATANHSNKYVDFAKKWCEDRGIEYNGEGWDNTIYWLAEKQWRDEYNSRLPLNITNGEYVWNG